MKKKLEFVLDGLNCVNCAMKIEKKINDLNNVTEATINIATSLLIINVEEDTSKEELVEVIQNIVTEVEPGVKVIERIKGKKSEVVKDLTCDDCHLSHDNVRKEEESNEHYHMHHEHTHIGGSIKRDLFQFVISAVIFLIALILDFSPWLELTLFLVSYLIAGGEVLIRAIKNILRGEIFDENFLMTIATIGAFAIGEYPEGAAVMLFYQIGEMFQDYAVNRSRKSIATLMDIRPDYVNKKVGEDITVVSPEEVIVGDIIVIKPGEKVPLDGTIIGGYSLVDTTALTGESIPREVFVGDSVLSGFVNTSGLLQVVVEKEYHDSTVAKILDMVENATNKKAPTERFITKFARIYTPFVTISAFLLAVIPPIFFPGESFGVWFYRALIFLVASCPCALVVSIPLGFFGGIGGASKQGILVKGSNFLEVLNDVKTIIFDKTGTLTKGVFRVTGIYPVNNMEETKLLELAAYAESYSNHPIALSIVNEYNQTVRNERISDYEEVAGKGIRVKVDNVLVLAGNYKLMEDNNIVYQNVDSIGSIIHLAMDGCYIGYLVISDELKTDSKKAIESLRALGIKDIVMLTGDTKKVGEVIASELGINKVFTDLLPSQKVEKLEGFIKEKQGKDKIMFVGDGINDAPVLALSDVGVAMGGLGSDAAIEAADVVLMTDEPSKIVEAIKYARRTRTIVWQNIIFALGVKIIVLILGAGGLATMWEAVFADVGVTLIAVLNSMRILKYKK